MAESLKANRSSQSTGILTPQISKEEIERLDQLYIFRDREKVLEFLEEHAFLVPVLLEAPEKIKPYFGDATRFLETYTDLEEGDWTFLRLRIARKLDWEEAFLKLEELIEAWVLELRSEVLTHFQIDLDYQ
jgi:hypothetical protein